MIMWPGIFFEFSVAQKEQQYMAKKAAGNGNNFIFGLIIIAYYA